MGMNLFSTKRAIGTTILMLLALTPFFNIGEICGLMLGKNVWGEPIFTPVYVKLMKDLGFLIILILGACNLKKLGKDEFRIFISSFIPLSLLTAILFFLSCKTSLFQGLVGLRWISPVFLAIFLIGSVDENLMRKMAKITAVVFMISLAVQIWEQFIMTPVPASVKDLRGFFNYHRSYDLRLNSGLFFMYHNAALFACAVFFLNYFYAAKTKLRILTLCLIPIHVLLSCSGTLLPTYILANYVAFIKGRIGKISMAVFIILCAGLLFALPYLVSRIGIMGNLIGGRAKPFIEFFHNAKPFSTRFGGGTNAMALYWQKFGGSDKGAVLDSTVNAVVVNMGLIGLFLAISAYIIWLFFVLRSGRPDAMVFTLIYSLFSLTIPVTEAFPGNLILAVGIAYFAPIIFRKKEKCVVA